MRSSNSKFDSVGWSAVIRDLEELNLNLSDLGTDAEGQSQNLSVLQNSIGSLSTNIQALSSALSALQAQVNGIVTRRTTSDIAVYSYGGATQKTGSSGAAVTVLWDTAVSNGLGGTMSSGAYSVPATGLYSVSCSAQVGGGGSCTPSLSLNLNGSIQQTATSVPSTSNAELVVSAIVSCSASDQITISAQSLSLQTNIFPRYLSITRL